MGKREHFTNGRCLTLGTGVSLVLASISLQASYWHHWIAIGSFYGSGIVLMLLASVLITKSYFSRHADTPSLSPPVPEPPGAQNGLDGLFTPLQIEAFLLARDMRVFYKNIDPNGTFNQVMHGYAGQFNQRLVAIMHQLAAAGVGVGFLEPYSKAISNAQQILDAAHLLDKLAVKLNCP